MPKFSSQKFALSSLKGILPTPQPQLPPQGLWKRITARLYRLLNRLFGKREPPLSGRIQQLEKTAEEMAHKLQKFHAAFIKKINPQLFPFLEAIVAPLLREVTAIQKDLHATHVAKQAKAFKQYSEWVERATPWIRLYERTDDEEEVMRAIVHYLIGTSIEVVERDLQILADYQNHTIAILALSEAAKAKLLAEIDGACKLHLSALKDLCMPPDGICLEEISLWRNEINKRRAHHFESALNAIDGVIERRYPNADAEGISEQLIEIYGKIEHLEEQLPQIFKEVEVSDLSCPMRRKRLLLRCLALHEEAHTLHLDLRLTADLEERIYLIAKKIEAFKTGLASIKGGTEREISALKESLASLL